jgi:tetratricopeptide (TPR) repeat protein
MKDSPEKSLWGMTGAFLKRLDAQERPKEEKPGAGKGVSSPERGQPERASSHAVSTPLRSREFTPRHKLALLYHSRRNYAQAERLYQEELLELEEALGPDHPDVASVLNNLGRLYYEQERYAEAEPLYRRSLQIVEANYGEEHPKAARRLVNLAELYLATGVKGRADALCQRALAIQESGFGPRDSSTVKSLKEYAAMLRNKNRTAEAEQLEARLSVSRMERRDRRRRHGERRGASPWYPAAERRLAGERRAASGRRAL